MAASITPSKGEPLRGSYRDPAGFVFRASGALYRQVNDIYRDHYDRLIGSGLYEALADRQLLIPHTEVQAAERMVCGAYKVLRPEQIRFVSYPYEWCFGQLRAAALATLAIQRTAIAYGMSLKDASAYNIQFRGCQPIHIDTLSFELYREGQPWAGYRQFCQHFLAPLTLMSRVDMRLGLLSRDHIDGLPLDLASHLLPRRTWLRPSSLLHLHIHALAQKRFSSAARPRTDRSLSRRSMLGLVDHLEAAIGRLRCNVADTTWADYDDHTNYSPAARSHKERLVGDFLAATHPGLVFDLGANSGRFSRMAAAQRAHAIAFDGDYGATENNYRSCRASGQSRVLPLVIDLTNPSPALGWAHEERLAWTERGPADVVLALALVHHLAIGNNLPFAHVARLFERLGRYLIVEFVPKADSQVQRLLASREDVFPDYTREAFEQAFEGSFRIHRAVAIQDSGRIMYLMERRSGTW